MLICDRLASQPLTFSCELFPPKVGGAPVRGEIVRETAALEPDFISVTYGAANSTAGNTLTMAQLIQAQGVDALAHLTCASSTREQLSAQLAQLRECGVQNLLALRGDLPRGEVAPGPDCYAHASDLVRAARAFGGFCIGGACYPEGHVESANQEQDILFLKEKVDAGCDFLTTQMFFDNSVLYRFLYKLYAKNITVPVLAGIMPVTNKKQIQRITALSSAALPPRFLTILDRFGEHNGAMEQAGIAYATEQIIDLIANGVRGVHLYTMNRPDIARRIMGNLSCIMKAG